MINVDAIKHPKEKTYFTIMAVVSVLLYFFMLVPLLFGGILAFPVLLLIALIYWFRSEFFKAELFGNCIHVNQKQYPEIYAIVSEQCRELGIAMPPLFVVNSNGTINAIAMRIFGKRYVLLYSSLVDILIAEGNLKQLAMITGHELGHHAAGHLSFGKSLLTGPASILPLIGSAYSRAKELTADRIGFALTKDEVSAKQGLIATIALGSKSLVSKTSIEAFKEQENEVPGLAGFLSKLFSSHPRATVRIIELEYFSKYGTNVQQNYSSPNVTSQSSDYYVQSTAAVSACPSCGTSVTDSTDAFCMNCGFKLK